jgi:alpha-mannosidase
LKGVSNDLVSYYDLGGLWRMGHEFWGGKLKELHRASQRPAQLRVRELEGGLEVACSTELDGQTIQRLLWLRSDSPVIRCRVEGLAAERRTVTVRFATDVSASRLVMDAVGGIVVRPPQRVYNPTFWPLQHFMHLQDDASGRGLALCLGMPGAASYRRDGRLEAIALRNATCERAFGLFPLLGLPAVGHERASHAFDYAIWFTPAGDWRENGIPQVARSISDNPWDTTGRAELRSLAASALTTDRPEVVVTAVKPASRGDGLIVRLSTLSYFGLPVAVTIRDRHLKAAFLCDARERNLGPLEVQGQTARLTMPGSIATVRLVI